jgi:coatomer subunit beta'
LIDKGFEVISFELNFNLVQYQQAIAEKDFENAEKIFGTIPKELHLKAAKFLEINDLKELAFKITPDPQHKYYSI